MRFAADLVILILAGGLFHAHLLHRLPSGEDGRWFSYAAFRGRGFRPFQTGFAAVYPLGVPWIAAQIGRIRPLDTARSIALFKIVWHVLTGVSVYALALSVFGEQSTALAAGLLFGVCASMPAADFGSTRQEHFLLLPMNLGLACLVMGMKGGDPLWHLGAGALLSWGREVEPRLAPLGLIAWAGSLVSLPGWSGPVLFAGGYLAVGLVPPALLTSERMLGPYLRERHVAVWKAGMDRWSLSQAGARLMLQVGPALGQLSGILILAAAQLTSLDSFPTLLMFVLVGVLSMLPLFSREDAAVRVSPMLAPISILAARTAVTAAQHGGGLESRAVVAAVVGMAVMQACMFLGKAYQARGAASKASGRDEAETAFLLETARIVRDLASPGEKLLVWGGSPVLHIHSGLGPFHHDALRAGPVMTREDISRVLDAVRETPPDWLLVDNRLTREKWGASDIAGATGAPFIEVHRLDAVVESGDDGESIPVILYRLDRTAWTEALLDHVRVQRLAGDKNAEQQCLSRLSAVSPEHPETKIRAMLQRSGMAANVSTTQLLAQQAERASGAERQAIFFVAGEMAEALGMPADALRLYTRCLKVDASHPRALSAAAGLLREGRAGARGDGAARNIEAAGRYLRRAERLAPHLPSVQYGLALLAMGSGDLEEAEERLDSVLAFMPGHREAEPKLRVVRRIRREVAAAPA